MHLRSAFVPLTVALATLVPASAQTAATPAATASSGDVTVLSPFAVRSDDHGYYASNTLSGTRLNSRIEDLAASLTVVTKAQMSDFALLDLNDIFLYEAGTEGTGTFTDFSVDRNGAPVDNTQLDPNSANRIRGVGPANISFGNFETSGRVPVDPSAIDAVEISRGPNASVFGLGSPSGTVNLVPSAAQLTADRGQTQFRADSYGGYRTSLDLNRVLRKNVLAVRGTAVLQHEGFVRQPSGVDTTRYQGMVKYQPFRYTAVSAGVSYYRASGNRPNFSPPRDSISYWLASGRPTWDPVTQQVHLNGATVGTFPAATYNGPDYFNNTFTGNNHSYLFIDQGGIGLFSAPSTFSNPIPLPGATAAGPTSGAQGVHFLSPSSAPGVSLGRFTAQPLFTTTPSVHDKSLYDWTEVNLAAVNRTWDRTVTASVQLDQVLFNTPSQLLFLQMGLLREDAQRYQRNYLGIANDNGQSGQLLIDVNERLLDGSPNPYFLRPYLGEDQPRTTSSPAKWDSYRAQLAYRLDLTHERGGLVSWLGQHQFSVYDEYKYRIDRRYSWREAILDAQPWIPAGLSRGNQTAVPGGPAAALAITRSYLRYYVGDNRGAHADYAPTDLSPGTYPFVWGNAATGVFHRDPAQLGLAAVTDSTGGPSNSKTILKTAGGIVQSHFLNEQVVTTFGLREDRQYQKAGATPTLLNADGTTFDYTSVSHWAAGDYHGAGGRTTQAGAVVRPFRGLSILRTVDDAGRLGHFAASALNGLSLTYNQAGSCTPQDPKTDVFLQPLPNPTGRGKESGFALNLLGGKFVLRVNRYDTKQLSQSGGDAGVIAQRVTRLDVAANAPFLLAAQAANWVRATHPGFTDSQVSAEVAREIGLSPDQQNGLVQAFNAGTISSSQDVVARGTEIELNYNPARFLTVAASITDAHAIHSNVSNDLSRWIAQRLPIWTTIKDPTIDPAVEPAQLWWNHNYGGTQTAAQNYASFVQTPFSVVRQLEGKSHPQIRRYAARVSTHVQLAGLTEHPLLRRFSLGGAIRWEDRAAIGYYGVQQLPATITDLDASRPIYDRSNLGAGWRGNFYFDAFVSYRTRLWADKIGANFQLNVRDLQESGHLQAIGAFPDGTPSAYRIVDPRKFILSATFDL
jgi:hypothetical protein